MASIFRKGLWLKTVLDLRASKWLARETALREARDGLELQIVEAYREPAASDREGPNKAKHAARLERCKAFGQHANPVPEGDQSKAQHGLFGTSAAFIVLSQGPWAQSLGGGSVTQDSLARQKVFLETLNFLDLAITSNSENGNAQWKQRDMTLRACMALRGLAAGCGVLAKPSLVHGPAYSDELQADLSGEPQRLASELAQRLADLLKTCLVRTDSVSGAFNPGTHKTQGTWLFSVGDESVPASVDEWVFMWAQVIASVSRAAAAGLISNATDLLEQDDLRMFRETVLSRSPPDDLDRRFQLIGVWALSHLDFVTPDGPIGTNSILQSTYMALAAEDAARLRSTVKSLTRHLLKDEVRLVDSWRPYSLKPTGDEWRDDFMVVPVVPVLLTLLGRYRVTTISDTSIQRLIVRSTTTEAQRDIGRSRPYQMGNRDGTVNLAYYQEAYTSLLTATQRAQRSFGLRALITAHGWWRGYGRAIVFLLIALAVAGSYLGLLNSPTDVGLGLIFGLGAAYVSAISAPPVISFFWGDRY